MKSRPPKSSSIAYHLLPKKRHQWEAIEPIKPEVIHQCVVCFKQKPGGYENHNECPGYPDLFLHFKEDIQLIIKV